MKQDFDETSILREELGIDSAFKGRIGLPADGPLRPELRRDFEFVIAASREGPFSQFFHDAKPLTNWSYETNCDLCNQKCDSNLYLLHCFRREYFHLLHLDKSVIYAGADCSKALLREKEVRV